MYYTDVYEEIGHELGVFLKENYEEHMFFDYLIIPNLIILIIYF